jgi:hypothetical protein
MLNSLADYFFASHFGFGVLSFIRGKSIVEFAGQNIRKPFCDIQGKHASYYLLLDSSF